MVSILGIVMRIGMNMRVDYGSPVNNVCMKKETCPCIVTCENYYTKQQNNFLSNSRIQHGCKNMK